ncbi:MAG TPA: hypothetical protein VIC26_04385, partial [Marinagarivorans sp.]
YCYPNGHARTIASIESPLHTAAGDAAPLEAPILLGDDLPENFDLDTYKILASFLLNKSQQARCGLKILPCVPVD